MSLPTSVSSGPILELTAWTSPCPRRVRSLVNYYNWVWEQVPCVSAVLRGQPVVGSLLPPSVGSKDGTQVLHSKCLYLMIYLTSQFAGSFLVSLFVISERPSLSLQHMMITVHASLRRVPMTSPCMAFSPTPFFQRWP